MTTTDLSARRSPNRQPGRSTGDSDKARAILAAWQLASFRGYVPVEKRSDRRLVVLTLIADLIAEPLPLRGLIVAADDLARDQWQQLLVRDGHPLEGWTVQTSVELLANGEVVDTNSIVIADELECYLTEEFAAALRGSCALLGLCSSPRALGEAAHLRRYVGKALTPEKSIDHLDFRSLWEGHRSGSKVDTDDPTETREQVLSTTNLENILGTYLSKMQKVALLTAEEEIDLAKRIEAGLYATQKLSELVDKGLKLPVQQRRDMQWICRDGERAKNRFIICNLRLVYQIARRYSRRMEIMDVIQEGNLGLIRAVEKFDYTKGFRFSTYATWWIRQSITRAIADKSSLIRIPVHMVESDNVVLTEWRKRSGEGASTQPHDIAAELGLDADAVEAAINRHRPPYSLELLQEAGFDLIDAADRDYLYERLSLGLLQDQVQAILETLSEREAGVIRLRFGLIDNEPRTLDEIGRVYGVTRERIRQIEVKTMDKLSHPTRSQVLKDYYDGDLAPD
jgi:RNA polymerase primary sigma factor